ncbi:MAG TPA: glycosyltransferase family A protein [Stellaceae bacterium]|nr:glycosyltransferase family A protein [Stellaceae bacterium]
MADLSATIVIPTKNRKDDLRRAIVSCLNQTVPLEVLVIDDGSTDGTAEMVKREFPGIRFHREEVSKGATVERNRGVTMASGSIVFSIDDDADFPSRHTVAQTLAEFDSPEVGVVSIPLINVNQSPEVLQRAPSPDGIWVRDIFWGGACAIRREVFLRVGGYREYLRQQHEEDDLAIRILDAGYFTRLGNGDPIHHYESPIRDRRRHDILGGRNKVLFAWHNVPMPDFLLYLPATCLKTLAKGVREGRGPRSALGIAKGLYAFIDQFGERKPVRRETYRLYRRMRNSTGVRIEEAKRDVPVGNAAGFAAEHAQPQAPRG